MKDLLLDITMPRWSTKAMHYSISGIRSRLRICLFIVLALSVNANSQSNEVLQSKFERLLSSSEFKHSAVSVTVKDIESGETIASHNPDLAVIPASCIKVLTTLSGTEMLSDSFQFVTRITHDGFIESDGTLQGNIYLEGTGDPSFGSSKFREDMGFEKLFKRLADAISKAGITCIDGKIIADESQFNSFPIAPTWQWNDLGNYYASGAWGININENQYSIVFKNRSVIGRKPTLNYHYPKIPNLKFSNEVFVDSTHTGDQAYIFGGPYNFEKRIVGTIPQGTGTFTIKGSIPDPPLFAAYYLSSELQKLDIACDGYQTQFYAKNKSKRKLILRVQSPYLYDIAQRANFDSNNLYTEAILKAIGKAKNGDATGQNGISGVRKILRNLKVDHKALNMEDGSGLSARNTASSYLLADFLAKYAKRNSVEYTTSLLAKAGRDGTVRGMMSSYASRNHVWLKSGSMNRVCNFVGIIQDKDGNWKSFAILINGFDIKYRPMRSKVEKMIDYIYRF